MRSAAEEGSYVRQRRRALPISSDGAQVQTATWRLWKLSNLSRVRRIAGLVVVAFAALCAVASAQAREPKVTLIGDSVADQLEHSLSRWRVCVTVSDSTFKPGAAAV